jgi:hypothetical protein
MTRIFQKFLRVSLTRKLLLLGISLLMAIVHTGLRLFSFTAMYTFLRRFHRAGRRPVTTQAAEELCWAVNRAGRFWFKDEGCLVQAMVGEMLLLRSGIPAKMVIGMRRLGANTFAHAWVESAGNVVVGAVSGGGMKDFQQFPEFQNIIWEGNEK